MSEADPDGCAACPLTQNPADAYRNSTAYGAYEVAMMKRTLELEGSIGVKVRGLVTWAFLFENQPYFAGYRVLSSNGIHLPVLNAFKLLGSLNGMRIPVTSSGALPLDAILANSVRQPPDVDAMATRSGQQIQILVWNYHDDIVTAPASPVHLSVQVPPGFGVQAAVDHLRVDDTHGDAYSVWVSQGRPAAPSAQQLMQLQQGMEPAPLQTAQTVDVTGGAINLDFDLPRFGISLVTVSPLDVADASADAPSSGGSSSGGSSSSGSSSSGSSGTMTGGNGGATEGDAGATGAPSTNAGCGCRVTPTELSLRTVLVLLPAAAFLCRRRRRRDRRAA